MLLKKTLTVLSSICMSIMIASCSQSPVSTQNTSESFGQAVIQLPQLPSNFLAKQAGIPRTLQLDISAPDMKTISLNWKLDSIPSEPVVISNIPAGANRVFEGKLFNSQGLEAYSGAVTATIRPSETVNVHLKLKATTGSAQVCIELEGFNNPNCFDDTIIHITDSWDIVLSSMYNMDTTMFTSIVNLKKDGDFISGVIRSNYIRVTNDSIVPDSMYVQGFIDAAKSETPVVYLYFTAYGSTFHMKARLSDNFTSLYNGVLYQYVTDKPYDLSMGKTSPVMKNTTLLANFSGTKSLN